MQKDKEHKRILIMKPSALGDVATALPALQAVRKRWPDARISWLVRPEFAPLLECVPAVDEIILFDRKLLGKFYKKEARRELAGLIRKLRGAKFDLVLDFQGLLRTALLGWISGCRRRYGMKGAREFAWLFYNHHVERPKDSLHVTDYYLKMTDECGARTDKVDYGIQIPEEAVGSAGRLLSHYAIDYGRYVVFICQSAHQWKCWPREKFAELADLVHDELKTPVVAVGTAGEREYIDEIAGMTDSFFVNLAGKTNLPELLAVLGNAKAVVTNDTGPGQIASTFDVPLVMVCGPSNPSRIGPYKREESVAAIDAFDRGEAIRSSYPGHRIECVGVEKVFERLRELIEHGSVSSSD
ncbi:Lipopolysaccharide heptosyltransferase 1 [Anaerohalosphaera lusitana]|uniref:Lipopolysaccharide heptosyltransferase 1 n=1 Tax=Anaerohalosphaera lusitana TaxID=1936003 RepID=A0A1U9NJA7_9BACT|nr:glycosyltransferase family 9 protein [Anaerohalosphaera lusitana]AQT68001.1 Lipopolysaccharide heptosyltransferase 1 [Anaerohalosphaera lusitana]